MGFFQDIFRPVPKEMRRGTPVQEPVKREPATGIASQSTVESPAQMEAAEAVPTWDVRARRVQMSDEAWAERIIQESNLPIEAPEGYRFNASLMEELASVPPEGMKAARGDNAPPPPFTLEEEPSPPEGMKRARERTRAARVPAHVYANGVAWEVGSRVGSGGYAQVYEVRHAGSQDQRPRLVKLMYLPSNERKRESLWNEVAAAMFTGDFVGSEILQNEQGETWAAVILERHAGETAYARYLKLQEREDEREDWPRFDPQPASAFAAAAMLRSVIHTLRRMHASGWTHRDVKPANVIFNTQKGEEWLSRLIDFGIAKREGHVRKTSSRKISGSPAFMLPEAFRNQEVDLRSRDYWGAALTAALTIGLMDFPRGQSVEDIARELEQGRMFRAPDLDDHYEADDFFQKYRLSEAHRAFVKWLLDFLRPRDPILIRQREWKRLGITKDVAVEERLMTDLELATEFDDDEDPELVAPFIDDDKFVRELEGHIRALGLQIGRTDVEEHLALLQEFPSSIETV